MSGLGVCRCGRCEAFVFPARLLCPRCGSREWHDVQVARGVVEEATTVQRRGSEDGIDLGSVRLPEGGVAIARLEGGATAGDDVSLEVRDGAIVARPIS